MVPKMIQKSVSLLQRKNPKPFKLSFKNEMVLVSVTEYVVMSGPFRGHTLTKRTLPA